MPARPFKKYAFLHILWVYIAWVAGYDLFRCLVDGAAFLELELNPAFKYLYDSLNSSIVAVCAIKFFTSCVCMTVLLHLMRSKYAVAVFSGIALVQTLVLMSYCPVVSPF